VTTDTTNAIDPIATAVLLTVEYMLLFESGWLFLEYADSSSSSSETRVIVRIFLLFLDNNIVVDVVFSLSLRCCCVVRRLVAYLNFMTTTRQHCL
jgi:hypothetical protein